MNSVALLEDSALNFQAISSSLSSTPVKFDMTSEGGDIYAAMRLGRFLRSNSGYFHVTDYCASACVLVLAGAVERWSLYDADVVIHRPYSTAVGEVGMQKRQKLLSQRNSDITKYLNDMNVPAELLDEMLAVPSHEGRRLSENELEYFLLHGNDPAWEEEQNAKEASKMGVSMTEYLRRRKNRLRCLEDGYPAPMCFKRFKKGE